LLPEIYGDIPKNSEKWESFCRQQVLLFHHYRSLEEAKGLFHSWSEQYINLGYAASQTIIPPEPFDDDVEDDRDTEIDVEQIHREKWMLAASIGPNVIFVEDVQLGMRDLDTSHNWAKGLDYYPNIEIDRKWEHNSFMWGTRADRGANK